MIRIVLCDDNQAELNALDTMVRSHLDMKKEIYEIRSFSSGTALAFEIDDKGTGDLYILDIDMPGTDGIALALRIREAQPNAILFFYTSHIEYATEGYKVEARRYLLKGGNEDYITEALDYAIDKIQKTKNETIQLKHFHDTINLPIADIQYVQREGRALSIYTQTMGTITTYESIKQLHYRINRPYFVFIDRGIFINIDYVRRTDHNTITLFNGTALGMSRNRSMDVKQAISKYWHIR